jgi:SagB-type dehydrogenase family enzyme
MNADASFRSTELDCSSFPAWRDAILQAEASGNALPGEPRSYPGYPRWSLPRVRLRLWPSLDRALVQRRCRYPLGTEQPARGKLSRILQSSHGITSAAWRGPVPSAGGLQALELYLVIFGSGWLPCGWYHYDRAGHHLSQLASQVQREELQEWVPSLERLTGGALLWVIVGDSARVRAKYAERGLRFLLLEAGHLMQNLCLSSTTLGLVTVPLGGYFESDLARRLSLLSSDEVLSVGVCGAHDQTRV